MNARALRIGNWVNHLWKKKGYIDDKWEEKQIVPNDIPACVKYAETYKPIPLSAEWLERFGFRKLPFISENPTDCYWELEDFPCMFIDADDDHFALCVIGYDNDTHLDTVHALQNFCFAFGGEELTLKEPG